MADGSLHSLPPGALKQIRNRIQKQKASPPSSSSENKKGSPSTSGKKEKVKKPPRTQKNFETRVVEPEELAAYDKLVEQIKSTIGTLTSAPIITFGKRYGYADSNTGQPCPYFAYSIPTRHVGDKREKGVLHCTDDWLGAFISETSMMTYLIETLGLGYDHPMVKQTAEYYGFKSNLANRHKPSVLKDFHELLMASRALGGKCTLHHPSQLGKGQKTLKRVWYYTDGSVNDVPDKLKSIDIVSLVEQGGFSLELGYKPFTYAEFSAAEAKLKEEKNQTSKATAEWIKIINESTPDVVDRLIEEAKQAKQKRVPKRKRGGGEEDDIVEEEGTVQEKKMVKRSNSSAQLKETIEKIEGKIIKDSVVNYFSDQLCSSSSDSDDEGLGGTSSEEEEPPKRNPSSPHVVKKKK